MCEQRSISFSGLSLVVCFDGYIAERANLNVYNTLLVEADNQETGEGSGNNYAYLVSDEASKEAVIIDPANPSE